MGIKIENDRLSTVLKSMMRLAQPEVVTMLFKQQILILKGQGQSSSCRFKIDVENDEPEKTQEITIDISLLSNVIDKLKNLEVTVGESTLLLKAKGFKIELASIDGQPIEVVPKEIRQGSEGIVLGTKMMAELLRYLPKIELRPLLSTYTECPVGIKTGPNGTFVACFDFVQSAFVKLDLKTEKPFDFVLPSISQFNILAKELAGQKYKIVITDTTLYAFNDMFQAALALPQPDGEQLQLSDVLGLVKSLKEMDYTTLIMKTSDVNLFLSSSRAVYDNDSVFVVKAKGRKAKCSLKATLGNASMITKLAKPVKDVEFKCDLKFFQTLVSRTSDKTIELRTTEQLMMLKEGRITYLMSLV